MKKRLLLTLVLAVVLCTLFAFAVNAEEYTTVDNLGDPSWYTGNYQLMTDKTSKVVLDNGDGTYTAYPAYYILKYSITVKDGAISEAYINGFDYSFVNGKTGKSYELGAIYKIELPNGLTTINSGIFGLNIKEPNVTEVVLPDSMTTVGAHAFRGTTKLKKVIISKNLTKIDSYAFYQAKGLEEVIFASNSEIELTIKDNAFGSCSALKELDLSKSRAISLGSNSISECENLEKLTLPECLETVGYCAIYKNPKMKLASDFLPVNLKTVGQHFLSGCKNINDVIYFPKGFEGFTGTYNFSSDKAFPSALTIVFLGRLEGKLPLEMVHTSNRDFTVILTKNTYADLKGKFLTAGSDGTFCYVGVTADTNDTNYFNKEGVLEIILGNSKDATSKYKTDENGNTLYYVSNNSARIYLCGGDKVELLRNVRTTVAENAYANYLTTPFTFDRQGHMDAGVHYDLVEVLSLPNCGVDGVTKNTCVLCDRVANDVAPATGNHTLYEVSACADKCEVCLKYVQKTTQIHAYLESLVYADYTKKGTKTVSCENLGCSYCVVEDGVAELFIWKGFAVSEFADKNGCYSVTQGFYVNMEAIKAYAPFSDDFAFGVVASVGKTNPISVVDGAVVADNNVIFAPISKNSNGELSVVHNYFDIKVTGIDAGNLDTKIAFNGYVVDGGKIFYLHNDATSETSVGNSYNEVYAILNPTVA